MYMQPRFFLCFFLFYALIYIVIYQKETKMRDFQDALRGVGLEARSEAQIEEEKKELEKQRLLPLLLRPDTNFRLVVDSNLTPENDKRMDPASPEFQPLSEVLYTEWNAMLQQEKEEWGEDEAEEKQKEFEQQWLRPLSESEVRQAFENWIADTKDGTYRKFLEDRREIFLQNMRDYEDNRGNTIPLAVDPPTERLFTDLESEPKAAGLQQEPNTVNTG